MNWTPPPPHLAARHGAEVVVSTLLKCGADPNAAEQSGWTPLHLAVQRGAFLSIIRLLEHREDVHARNKVGWTPAQGHSQGQHGNPQSASQGWRPAGHPRRGGCTPLQLALRSQKHGIIVFPESREPSLAILGGAGPGAQTEI